MTTKGALSMLQVWPKGSSSKRLPELSTHKTPCAQSCSKSKMWPFNRKLLTDWATPRSRASKTHRFKNSLKALRTQKIKWLILLTKRKRAVLILILLFVNRSNGSRKSWTGSSLTLRVRESRCHIVWTPPSMEQKASSMLECRTTCRALIKV